MLQLRPKCRQITNPKLINFFSSSSSSSKNNRQSSSLSSLASYFSESTKSSPATEKQQSSPNHRKTISFVSSSDKPTVKIESLDEIREKLMGSRRRSSGSWVSPPSSTQDSTIAAQNFSFPDLFKPSSKDTDETLLGHVEPRGGSPFLEQLRLAKKSDPNGGLGMQRLETESQVHRGLGEDKEDRMFVDTLLEFHRKGLYYGDTGFKKGALQKMKSRMKRRGESGTQLINSWIKSLRTHWSAIHGLLTGKSRSGFRWDPEKKCVTAENHVWDAHVKAHPQAAKLRNMSFPYYDDLCIIYSKDIASVKDAETLTDDDFGELDGDEVNLAKDTAIVKDADKPINDDFEELDIVEKLKLSKPAMKKVSIDELRQKFFETRLSSAAPPPVSASPANDSTNAAQVITYEADNVVESFRENLKQLNPSGGENANHIGSLLSFPEKLMLRTDNSNHSLVTRRFQSAGLKAESLEKAHPDAAKLRNPPFSFYDDADADAWIDAFNKDVTAENGVGNDVFNKDVTTENGVGNDVFNKDVTTENGVGNGVFNEDVTAKNDILPGSVFEKKTSQRKEEDSSVVPAGLKTESQEHRGIDKKRKVWTLTEDRLLVDTLLEFHSKGLYHPDIGFIRGAMQEIRSRMKMTGTRVYNRIRKLKTHWFAIHTLLTGQNSGAFVWDTEKKCVTAKNDVWNAEAAKLNTYFPYYEDLWAIWGKDRAIGNDVETQTTDDDEDSDRDRVASGKDVETPTTDDVEDPDRNKLGDGIAFSTSFSHTPNVEQISKGKRKRMRSESDDYLVDAVGRALTLFSESFEHSASMLSKALQLDVTEKQMKINGELEKIDNLSALKRFKVGYMIASDVSKLNLFFSLPEAEKKDWVTALLNGEF